MSDEFEFEYHSAVRGHHVYQEIWTPTVVDILLCVHEPRNEHDRFAIACFQDGTVAGHLPQEIAGTSYYFLQHGGSIEACITGPRQYCREAGGMEVPCKLRFTGKRKHIKRLKEILTGK